MEIWSLGFTSASPWGRSRQPGLWVEGPWRRIQSAVDDLAVSGFDPNLAPVRVGAGRPYVAESVGAGARRGSPSPRREGRQAERRCRTRALHGCVRCTNFDLADRDPYLNPSVMAWAAFQPTVVLRSPA